MRVFHFIFGLHEQTEPFHLAHYLCLASCLKTQTPDRIFFHHRHLPFGPWWDKVAHQLTLRSIGKSPDGFSLSPYAQTSEGRYILTQGWQYAHEADFLRLEILKEFGGVYADMDTLFLERYPDEFFQSECILGEEPPVLGPQGILCPSLCNAVIFSRPNAQFIKEWLHRARSAFDGTWSTHSCQLATQMWREAKHDLLIVPKKTFYRFGPSRTDLRLLFEESTHSIHGALSIHLWAHLWWGSQRRDFSDFHSDLLDDQYVRLAETTYARLARKSL